MARININTGTTANDGTGDPLRTAFTSTNANFIELYAGAGGVADGSITTVKLADNAVDADKLNVTGNGTVGQALLSDGDGTFSWGAAGESYTAGTGITLTGTEFSIGQAVETNSNVQFNSLGIGTAAPGTAGLIRATNDVVAYYSSDKRLKENIKPIENALDKVSKLGGYEFDWNDKQDVYEGHDIGVIAQEVEAVFPELVTDRDNGFKAVKYEKLVPALIEAIKELKAEVESLKSK